MDSGVCPPGYEGGFAVDDQFRATAVHLCFATSQCKGPGLCPAPWNPESVCRNLRDAMLGGLNKIDSEGVANPTNHVYELKCDESAGCFVVTNGYLDAWGRRYGANVFPPTSRSYLADWSYNGECDPVAIQACPQPQPTPRPSVAPTPEPSVSPVAGCPKPDGIKLGFRDARKLDPGPGYHNSMNITPLAGGVPVPEGCGQFYFDTYGQPDAYQTGPGFTKDPVERASGDSFGGILTLATNTESQWSGGKYIPAGPMTICTSYPWLSTWRCQDGTMNDQGALVGFGPNSQGYDLRK